MLWGLWFSTKTIKRKPWRVIIPFMGPWGESWSDWRINTWHPCLLLRYRYRKLRVPTNAVAREVRIIVVLAEVVEPKTKKIEASVEKKDPTTRIEASAEIELLPTNSPRLRPRPNEKKKKGIVGEEDDRPRENTDCTNPNEKPPTRVALLPELEKNHKKRTEDESRNQGLPIDQDTSPKVKVEPLTPKHPRMENKSKGNERYPNDEIDPKVQARNPEIDPKAPVPRREIDPKVRLLNDHVDPDPPRAPTPTANPLDLVGRAVPPVEAAHETVPSAKASAIPVDIPVLLLLRLPTNDDDEMDEPWIEVEVVVVVDNAITMLIHNNDSKSWRHWVQPLVPTRQERRKKNGYRIGMLLLPRIRSCPKMVLFYPNPNP
jgi:hypothetical protein